MVSRKVFEKYLEIQKSGEMNMLSINVERNTGISSDAHIDIIKNYKEIFNRYERNLVEINGVEYPIEAEYQSEERCLMDGYKHVRDDIYIKNNSISIVV